MIKICTLQDYITSRMIALFWVPLVLGEILHDNLHLCFVVRILA